MGIKSMIIKKRAKMKLDEEEIREFIFKYYKEEILDEQAAALLTLMYTNEISENEAVYLTQAMAETGEELELNRISNEIVDFHSIGGIGDKLIIILMSVMSSLGVPMAKICGRELGMIDRLSTIPGFRLDIELENLKNQISEIGEVIIAEPENIAPIENKMYRLRNSIACNDNVPLIAISIMSQKVAVGSKNIVFDITCGKDAYVKNKNDAKKLAKYLIFIGKKLYKNVSCIISDLDEPLGNSFGNLLEIKEIVQCLNGYMTSDIYEMIVGIGCKIMAITEKEKDLNKSKQMIINAINNGSAYNSFIKLIDRQSGDIQFINNISDIGNSKIVVPVLANSTGFVEKIDVDLIRSLGIYLGAIRSKKDDVIDYGSGIVLSKKIGEQVNIGEILAYVHTNDDTKIKGAVDNLKNAFKISDKKVTKNSRILDFVN